MKLTKGDIKNYFNNNIDLYICSAGFEIRTLAFSKNLNSDLVKKSVNFHISESYYISFENYQKIKSYISNIEFVEFPKNNSMETFDIFNNYFLEYIKSKTSTDKLNIVIDVTTFTREVLLILLKVLANHTILSQSIINFVYTPAESYPCEWMTKGIRQIRSIFGYSGLIYPSKKTMLVILSGFELERADEIIKSFEPNLLALGKPSKEFSINEKLDEIGNKLYTIIKNRYSTKLIKEFEFSCLEITQTVSELEQLIDIYSHEYNIIISPMNNKISTLAAAIVGLKNDKIQISYASANQYNINEYSKESDYFLTFKLNDFFISEMNI